MIDRYNSSPDATGLRNACARRDRRGDSCFDIEGRASALESPGKYRSYTSGSGCGVRCQPGDDLQERGPESGAPQSCLRRPRATNRLRPRACRHADCRSWYRGDRNRARELPSLVGDSRCHSEDPRPRYTRCGNRPAGSRLRTQSTGQARRPGPPLVPNGGDWRAPSGENQGIGPCAAHELHDFRSIAVRARCSAIDRVSRADCTHHLGYSWQRRATLIGLHCA